MLQDGEKRFPMGARMQGAAAIAAIGIAVEIRIRTAGVEQRREVRLKLGPQKVRISGATSSFKVRRTRYGGVIRRILSSFRGLPAMIVMAK